MSELELELGIQKEICNQVIPIIIRNLLRLELLEKDKLHDRDYIIKIIGENRRVIIGEMGMNVKIHHEFIEAAKEAFSAHRFEVAIVLLATAIEQSVNFFYREVLNERGLFTDKEITEVIRSNNIAPKIGWLLTLVSEYEIYDELQKRVLNLTELRNQIIHHKALPSSNLDDDENGSHNVIEKNIKALDFNNLFSIPDDLSEALDKTLEYVREKNSPDYKQAKEILELHFHDL
jgi:hypothetical protein